MLNPEQRLKCYPPSPAITRSAIQGGPALTYSGGIVLNIQDRLSMPFVPGHSGNPGGRPKATTPDGRSLAELAREHTEAALNALVRVLDDAEASHAAIVSAATAILDRGYGRPRQDMSLEIKSDDQAASLLEQARRRAIEARPH